MVGALSIVRFRTPIKDPMDLVYLFWSIIVGILCGAGFILLAVIGSIVIGIVLIVFANKITVQNPYLVVVKFDSEATGQEIETILKEKTKKFSLKSKSIMMTSETEATYEVRVKENDSQIVNSIAKVKGVASAVMLSYDGNFTA